MTVLSLPWQQKVNQEEKAFLRTEVRQEAFVPPWIRPQNSLDARMERERKQQMGVGEWVGVGVVVGGL